MSLIFMLFLFTVSNETKRKITGTSGAINLIPLPFHMMVYLFFVDEQLLCKNTPGSGFGILCYSYLGYLQLNIFWANSFNHVNVF